MSLFVSKIPILLVKTSPYGTSYLIKIEG